MGTASRESGTADATRKSNRVNAISAGAAQGLLAAMQKRLSADLRLDVHATFAPVGTVDDLVRAGDPCDVVITSEARFRDLVIAGLVDAASCRQIGLVATCLAVRSGRARPRLDDEADLRGLLLGAGRVHCNDPARATAGTHFFDVLARLNVSDTLRDRLVVHPNGAETMRALAADPAIDAVGCAQATEVAAARGVCSLGGLPGRFGLTTIYVAGLRSPKPRGARSRADRADSRAAAMHFVDAICGEASRSLRSQCGFDDAH